LFDDIYFTASNKQEGSTALSNQHDHGAGDVRYWSARAVCRAFAAKTISVEEYTRELIAACTENRALNAFISLDETRALAVAKAKDKSPSSGLLHGLPMAIKDAIGTRELPTTAGTKGLGNHRPARDADVVARLVDAGAFVFGKLNMHELSYGVTSNNSAFGAVRNPYGQSRIPGGSSGGAGAAVASGMAPAALGTDTGGSVRIPAALCGVVGFRPSIGRYSQRGIVPVSATRDTAGPLCRGVDDAAFIDAAIMAEPDRLDSIAPGDLRLGIPANHYFDHLHAETGAVMATTLERLRAAGCNLIDVTLDGIEAPTEACGFPIALYETKRDLARYLAENAPDGPSLEELIARIESPDVKAILSMMPTPEYDAMAGAYRDAIENRRPKLQKILRDCIAQGRLDAILFPTTILPATPIGEDDLVDLGGREAPLFPSFVHNTDPGSTAGIPGITLPAGLSASGLPIGLGLDGPFGCDRRLLAVAHTLEGVLPALPRPNSTGS
jgi:mandelamide amidase